MCRNGSTHILSSAGASNASINLEHATRKWEFVAAVAFICGH